MGAMTWCVPEPPPAHVTAVRDAAGNLWRRRTDDPRCWQNGDLIWFWETLLHKRGPLTAEEAPR